MRKKKNRNNNAATGMISVRREQYQKDKEWIFQNEQMYKILQPYESQIDVFTQHGEKIRFIDGARYIVGCYVLQGIMEKEDLFQDAVAGKEE